MFNSSNLFNGTFGKVAPGMCRVTMNGEIAVKCDGNNYKSYNLKKKRLTNVTNFCFDAGDDFFFVIPTTKVVKGDIILVEGRPKCVIDVTDEAIKVIDYNSSEIREVVPERHVIMGSTYFYGKIVSLFGNMLKGGKGGLGNIFKLSMISQMMGNGNNGGNSNGMFGGNIGQLMGMSMLMGGKDNMFEGLFDDFSLDFQGLDDDDDETETKEA